MAESVVYKPDRRGMAQMASSDEVRRIVEQRAEQAKEWAEAHSPRMTGTYARSFRVESDTSGGWDGRASARLVNDAPHAALVEWANGSHVLARAAAAVTDSKGRR